MNAKATNAKAMTEAMLYEAALGRANRALDEARHHAAERTPRLDAAWTLVMDEWTAARMRLAEVSGW